LSERYTGFRQLDVSSDVIDSLYKNSEVNNWDQRLALYPNMYLELKDLANEKHTALGCVTSNGNIRRVYSIETQGIKPRNREQVFAMDALMNRDVTVVVLTGTAGTGKTLMALAMALSKVEDGTFQKVILTRPMSEVGKYKLGALPGDVNEKFSPYLLNYMTNLEQFTGNRKYVTDLLEQSKFEIVPLQLVRGASFNHCLVIADEMQVCNHMEMLTIGTRTGEGSKIVIMGDLNQRDENIAKDKTGIYKMMNSPKTKESPLVAAIELQRCERSATARLFAEVFEESQ
jgi:PhoH-like ATPase